MRQSDSIAKVGAAIVAFQADMGAVPKSATNPHFKSKYAKLDDIIKAARPHLAKHGLAVMQESHLDKERNLHITHTRIVHSSGEWVECGFDLPADTGNVQKGMGTATYGRRGGYGSALSIATEDDDDGNAAAKKSAPKTSAAQKTHDKAVEMVKEKFDATEVKSKDEKTLADSLKVTIIHCKKHGMDDAAQKKYVAENFGLESRSDMNKDQLRELYAYASEIGEGE